MTLYYESGDARHPALWCDAEGCSNRLSAPSFVLGTGMEPSPRTGWVTVDADGNRRDYCATHAGLASA